MKNFYIIRNKLKRPSTFYRIIQYINLNDNENKLFEYENNNYYECQSKNKFFVTLNKIINLFMVGYLRRIYSMMYIFFYKNDYNLVIQREVFPRFMDPISKKILEKNLIRAKKIIWDFDDNILDLKEITTTEFDLLSKYATKIFVGNEYLESMIPNKFKFKVSILNTSDSTMSNIDLKSLNERRKQSLKKEVTILWVGTKKNLVHLETVIESIDKSALEINKKVILKIVSDGRIEMKTKKLNIKNISWTRERAIKEFENSHIGIMPLEKNNITEGKCAFKAVQSIGMGLPVIISNVGMNSKVINNNGVLIQRLEEWEKSLEKIIFSDENWLEMSENSRELWEEKFNSFEIKNTLFKHLGSE